ncbi:alpha-ketoacid dehydrogenase subunit beta [Candidatus Woesearchaeota archaeon CG_4_10_14_0_2_um_filter_57_5]|nr:MAG: alpha-ketoacid dehydrogenase subunit beta [Candidatus Woesearchaeota archaeon CG1_02_57_44]PIZ51363.1 MAG: alpha-ketoacid dehydrogenase subunit beta [Candidatus Woesearchaeota archaeon CG_4_10_14_0_2_um_filter_57_5]
MTVMNILEAVRDGLRQELKADPDVVLFGEDIGRNGGVFRTTDGLFDEFPGRVIDTPLAELGIVASAVGMAAYGMRPVVEIQFSGFVYGAMEQLISHAARLRNRTRGKFTCPMVLRAPYSGGIRALEHHSESMEAFYVHTQGLKVVIPSNPYDAKGLLIAAIRDPDPVIFLEPKRIYRAVKAEVPDGSYVVPLGRASILREGTDITVVSWGSMMKSVLDAATELQGKASIEVLDLRTLSPMDTASIIASVEKTGRLLVVSEEPRTCSVAGEILAQVAERAMLSLQAPPRRVTGFDTIMPLYKMENDYIPSKDKIMKAILDVVSY